MWTVEKIIFKISEMHDITIDKLLTSHVFEDLALNERSLKTGATCLLLMANKKSPL